MSEQGYGFVSPRIARLVRVDIDAEKWDAVRAGELALTSSGSLPMGPLPRFPELSVSAAARDASRGSIATRRVPPGLDRSRAARATRRVSPACDVSLDVGHDVSPAATALALFELD